MENTVSSNKKKMKESVCKIKAMVIFPSTACVFYNTCSCTKVCFGCGIMALTLQQEQELMKTCEPVILKKFGLGENCQGNDCIQGGQH